MKASELTDTDYPSSFGTYIALVEDVELIEGLEESLASFLEFAKGVPLDKLEYAYAVGKWTLKDIIQHNIDCERIFNYRALRIARKDQTNMEPFDEDFYAANVDANQRTLDNLLEELVAVRKSSIALFVSFSEEQLRYTGFASGKAISVSALGFTIIGHEGHHSRVFRERYL
jgi:hypothetical protein